jgi:hypothetical protein
MNRKYNEQLLKFYNDNRQNTHLFGTGDHWRPPLFCPDFRRGGILYIGINPSTGGIKDAIAAIGGGRKRPLYDGDADKLAEAQNNLYDRYAFFKKRKKHADDCFNQDACNIAHLDIYPFRLSKGTGQASAVDLFKKISIDGFHESCERLFSTAIKAHKPKFVWLANFGAWNQLNERGVFPGIKFEEKGCLDRDLKITAWIMKIKKYNVETKLIVSKQLSGRPYYSVRPDQWKKAHDAIRDWAKQAD